ncbi:hypothetical protein [Actinomadura sp. WMMB 499]|uniref:hypothetical protein n=1 Tax=Actinomadura sp. WMMB 499 TaxID=1219491 RepID=UPI0012485B04|nr:hypothetical protein [Actinomadura sp. WMMB 499]QFG22897.1 hypothetical protein F7P10_19030 [Actinomadura sp. WMMB 499]
MHRVTINSVEAIVYGVLVLAPSPVLALILWNVGPEHVTGTDLEPLYWAPALLASVSGAVALWCAHVRRTRWRCDYRSLYIIGSLGVVMLIPLGLFALVCLIMSSIGTQDGGWS